MEIREFEDLTEFMSTEYSKMVDTYGFKKPSTKFSKFIEGTLQKYSHLYDKPLFKLKKKELKLVYKEKILEFKIREALSSMPHGKLWQFIHADLWKRMQPYLKQEAKKEPKEKHEEPQVLVPEIVRVPPAPAPLDEEE